MKVSVRSFRVGLHNGILVLLVLALAACAPAKQARKRYFWPPGFENPKIEYINFYQSDRDIHRGEGHWLENAVFGKEAPKLQFVRPSAIAVAKAPGDKRVFVADQGLSQVEVWDFGKQQIRRLQTALEKDFGFILPSGLATDVEGKVYVADSLKKEIDVFGKDETLMQRIADPHLERPTGIAIDNQRKRIYVVDTKAHLINVLSLDGRWLSSIGKRGAGPGEFNFPLDLDLDAKGNLYVLDSMNARVQVLSPEGKFIRQFGERGTEIGSFQIPKGIAVSPSGLVYVTDSMAHRFVVFSVTGDYLESVGGAYAVQGKVAPGGFYLPEGIDVGNDDSIWVVDSLNRMFHQFQYLTPEYLQKHPINPEDVYLPPGFKKANP